MFICHCRMYVAQWYETNCLFSNSNIYPLEEYETRKQEIIRFLAQQGVPYIEDEYNHDEWRKAVTGLENEPERGPRCSVCFLFRLKEQQPTLKRTEYTY